MYCINNAFKTRFPSCCLMEFEWERKGVAGFDGGVINRKGEWCLFLHIR